MKSLIIAALVFIGSEGTLALVNPKIKLIKDIDVSCQIRLIKNGSYWPGGVKNLFAFIDESCFPKPNETSDHSVLLATCIKMEDIRSITQRVYQLKLNIFGGGTDVEIKAKNFIIPKTLRPDRSRNKEFVDRLFEIIEGESIRVYAMVMEKPDYKPYVHPEKLPIHYTYLLHRINAYATALHRPISVIFDGQDAGTDEDVSKRFYNLVYRAGGLDQIIEMPLFVSSKIVPGIQIADLMAGVTRHYYNQRLHENSPANSFQEFIAEKYRIIDSKTARHRINNYNAFGIHIIGKTTFPRSEDN